MLAVLAFFAIITSSDSSVKLLPPLYHFRTVECFERISRQDIVILPVEKSCYVGIDPPTGYTAIVEVRNHNNHRVHINSITIRNGEGLLLPLEKSFNDSSSFDIELNYVNRSLYLDVVFVQTSYSCPGKTTREFNGVPFSIVSNTTSCAFGIYSTGQLILKLKDSQVNASKNCTSLISVSQGRFLGKLSHGYKQTCVGTEDELVFDLYCGVHIIVIEGGPVELVGVVHHIPRETVLERRRTC